MEGDGDDAVDNAVADLMAGELIDNGLIESVKIGDGQYGGGTVGRGHWACSGCAVVKSARGWTRLMGGNADGPVRGRHPGLFFGMEPYGTHYPPSSCL